MIGILLLLFIFIKSDILFLEAAVKSQGVSKKFSKPS